MGSPTPLLPRGLKKRISRLSHYLMHDPLFLNILTNGKTMHASFPIFYIPGIYTQFDYAFLMSTFHTHKACMKMAMHVCFLSSTHTSLHEIPKQHEWFLFLTTHAICMKFLNMQERFSLSHTWNMQERFSLSHTWNMYETLTCMRGSLFLTHETWGSLFLTHETCMRGSLLLTHETCMRGSLFLTHETCMKP